MANWALDENLVFVYDCIKICDATSGQCQREHLLVSITKALDLIQQNDPRRMRRVKTYLNFIASYNLLAIAQYEHLRQVCFVDFNRIGPVEDKREYLLFLASTIVHEATHGLIKARKIRTLKNNRYRIERLCHKEEVNFLRRAAPGLVPPEFDQQGYERYFGTSRLQLAFDWVLHFYRMNSKNR